MEELRELHWYPDFSSVSAALLAAELEVALAIFEVTGGRGVVLAEYIDALRAALGEAGDPGFDNDE